MMRKLRATDYYRRWSDQELKLMNASTDQGMMDKISHIEHRWWEWAKRQTFPGWNYYEAPNYNPD